MRNKGFTLLEMLIALGVFAVLGVLANTLLYQMIRNQEHLSERSTRLADAQRAMQILQRDFLQFAERPIRDELGDPMPALELGGIYPLSLSRLGWRNPLQLPRSDIQRVAYALEDEALVRYYWTVLDRAEDSLPRRQLLLEDVRMLEVSIMDVSGNNHSFWPPLGEMAMDPAHALAAVSVRMEVPPFGELVRVWDLPSVNLLHGPPPLEEP